MKVLLICESSYRNASGGRVVRYLSKILKDSSNCVKILVLSNETDDVATDQFYKEFDVEFFPLKYKFYYRLLNLFFSTSDKRKFQEKIKKFSPDIIHFASFDSNKPAYLIEYSKKSGALVVLQPWTMEFYCEQGFGFRDGARCTLCADGSFYNSVKKNCCSYKRIPYILERKYLRKEALKADVFLSSNGELDNILSMYGVEKERIVRFPVPFDYTKMTIPNVKEGDYFIFLGQANAHKGVNVLIKAFERLPDQKLKIFPFANLSKDVSHLRNVEVITGVTWGTGLGEALASAKAVLLPTLWSSSTEYALCEALSFKKPVILFNVGVHKHIFRNMENAIVLEPNNVEMFCEAIITLDRDSKLREKLGQRGFEALLEINDPVKL